MMNKVQRAQIAMICLWCLVLTPLWAREGGGLRGGGGRREGGAPPPHAAGGAAPGGHVAGAGAGAGHGAVGIHGGPSGVHGGGVGANHSGHFEHGGGPGIHNPAMLHQPGPHWNGYHQAYIGNHSVHLAWAGYRPSYYYHPWYHGPWGGHAWGWGWGFGPGLTFGIGGGGFAVGVGWGYPAYYGPYGRYGYWGRPLGWGFGGWGLGTTVYVSGYYPYYNPYYYQPAYPTVVYDYSRPIVVATQAPPGTPPGAPSTYYDGTSSPGSATPPAAPPLDNPAFDMARDSFKRGDYAAALKDVDAAIRRNPSDAVMHEFRSLTLFAMRDYRQSAAVAHSVLSVGPGWDYTTMSSLYPDPFTYSEQLQRLEDYTHEHPRAAEAHFLLAYHEMIGSRKEEAANELQQVVRLMPTDRLASELLMMVKGPAKQPVANPTPGGAPGLPPNEPSSLPSPSVADSSDMPAVDKALLPGTWNAARDDGSKFRLTMTADGRFTWQYSPPGQKGEEFSGTYSVDGPVLVLERKEGGALAGTAQFSGDSNLNFKMVGGPPEDKGLNFGRL